jgi:hypothetical protein
VGLAEDEVAVHPAERELGVEVPLPVLDHDELPASRLLEGDVAAWVVRVVMDRDEAATGVAAEEPAVHRVDREGLAEGLEGAHAAQEAQRP